MLSKAPFYLQRAVACKKLLSTLQTTAEMSTAPTTAKVALPLLSIASLASKKIPVR